MDFLLNTLNLICFLVYSVSALTSSTEFNSICQSPLCSLAKRRVIVGYNVKQAEPTVICLVLTVCYITTPTINAVKPSTPY